MAHLLFCAIMLFGLDRAFATFDIGFRDDSDLTNFVTRPEIKAPIFNVSVYEPEKVSPGLWVIAPYAFIQQDMPAKNYYQPCQTGPAIYDGNGDLVWSGACQVRNQNTCDLRVWDFNNTQYLSAILNNYRGVNDEKGHGIIMNSSYEVVQEIHTSTTIGYFNMHELNLIEDGTKALYLLFEPIQMDLGDMQRANSDFSYDAGWVADMGFREVDLTTGTILFEWWAGRSRHVSLTESKKNAEHLDGPYPKAWNWFHGNSIEKNAEGDYMISSRYLDTIFKISGEDGHVIWRLGGYNSSFVQDFNFSRQHDARWISMTPDKEVISFLDNASDETSQTSSVSSALVIELDRKSSGRRPKHAKVVQRIERPDGGLTRLRGNHQVLKDGNHFVCWSGNSYLSEHGPDGKTLMEARFASKRFVTYRAYKFNFTAVPSEPPTTKAFVYGTSPSRSTTVIYVSWNGATEVSRWRFRAGETVLGEKTKTGFETSFQTDGYHPDIHVQAIASDGSVIGRSLDYHVAALPDWVGEQDVVEPSLLDDENGQEPILEEEHEDDVQQKLSFHMNLDGTLDAYKLTMIGLLLGVVIGTARYVYSCRRRARRSHLDWKA